MGKKKEHMEPANDLFIENGDDQKTPVEQFEPLLSRLEEIVGKLEGGGLTLSESLRLYEEGTGHVDRLTTMLGQVREHVMKLMTDTDGGQKLDVFTGEESS